MMAQTKQATTRQPAKRGAGRLVVYLSLAVGLLVIVCGVLTLLDLKGRKTTTSTKRITFTGSTVSFVNIASGSVHIERGETGSVVITEKLTQGVKKLVTTEKDTGNTLTIAQSGGCGSSLTLGLFGNCDATYTLQVPANTTIIAHGGDDDYSIDGVSGNHDISTGAGEIDLNNVAGETLRLRSGDSDIQLTNVHTKTLQATTSAGKVTLRNVVASDSLDLQSGDSDITGTDLQAASVKATTGAGKIALQFNTDLTKLVARSGDSDVTITLPHSTVAYKTTAKSDDSTAAANIKTDPSNSKNTITATSGAGKVLVQYAQ